MRTLFKRLPAIAVTIVLCALTSCASKPDTAGFWAHHSIIVALGWFLVPRLMFWFVGAMTGGFWFWHGVLLVPQIIGAYWLTFYYWHTNPVLCVVAWVAGLGAGGATTGATARAAAAALNRN